VTFPPPTRAEGGEVIAGGGGGKSTGRGVTRRLETSARVWSQLDRISGSPEECP
jgi:hypothetical protein